MSETTYIGPLALKRGDPLTITRNGQVLDLRVTSVEKAPGEESWTVTTELADGDAA